MRNWDKYFVKIHPLSILRVIKSKRSYNSEQGNKHRMLVVKSHTKSPRR